MEELKEQLYKELYLSIANYGLTDKRTVELSQKLDLVVVREMKNKLGGISNEGLS